MDSICFIFNLLCQRTKFINRLIAGCEGGGKMEVKIGKDKKSPGSPMNYSIPLCNSEALLALADNYLQFVFNAWKICRYTAIHLINCLKVLITYCQG